MIENLSSNCYFTFGYFFRPELHSIFRFLQATKPEFYAKIFQLFNVEEKEEIDEILDFLSTRDSYQKVLIISTNADNFRFIKKSKHPEKLQSLYPTLRIEITIKYQL